MGRIPPRWVELSHIVSFSLTLQITDLLNGDKVASKFSVKPDLMVTVNWFDCDLKYFNIFNCYYEKVIIIIIYNNNYYYLLFQTNEAFCVLFILFLFLTSLYKEKLHL